MSHLRVTLLLAAAGVMLSPQIALAQPAGPGPSLPDGAGKNLVQGMCTACHTTREIVNSSGYTKDGWNELTATMVDLSKTPKEREQVTQYLAANFPPNTKRAPKLVEGDLKVRFHEWQVPTLGQRSRDPVEAADGTIWWAGQWGNLIGKINPKTGEMKEYPLPPKSMPHSVLLDTAGNVWYTGNKNATIGKLDPKTEKITVYKMPDPNAKDPHTAKFSGKGILFFTLQNSNMIGRLNPANGEIKLVTAKTPSSKPYGIKFDANDVPWVACNGSNCLIKVNPDTLELTEVKLPERGTTVRRLEIAPDGMIWFVNSALGRLGRYNPKTGEIKEWASPSGPKSHPYAIVAVGGAIWYNESAQRPDALVRFDPKTETFQSWPIPTGKIHAGIIRHMRATRDGKGMLIHQSSTNRITRVTIEPPPATR